MIEKPTQTKKDIESLYFLKKEGLNHLNNKCYLQASVYLEDVLTKFDTLLYEIETEEEMEKLVIDLQIPARKNISLCYLKLGKHQQCIKYCRLVLDIQPKNVKFLYRLGKAYRSVNKLAQARQTYQLAHAEDPKEEEVNREIKELKSQEQEAKRTKEKKPSSEWLRYCALLPYYFLQWVYIRAGILEGSKRA